MSFSACKTRMGWHTLVQCRDIEAASSPFQFIEFLNLDLGALQGTSWDFSQQGLQ